MKEQDLRLEFAALDEVSLPDREAVLGRVTAGLACEDAREDAHENARTAPHPRRRAWKLLLPIAACVAVMVTMMVVMMVGVGSEDKVSYMNCNRDEWFVRPNGGVKRELAEQIKEGMYLNDVIELIGKPNRPILETPYQAFQWDLDTGECLHLYCFPTTIVSVPIVDGKLDWSVPFDIYHKIEIIEIEQNGSTKCNVHWPRDEYNIGLEKLWKNTDKGND